MGINIAEFEKISTDKHWKEFSEWFHSKYPNILFEKNDSNFNLFEVYKMEINHWKNNFDWKIFLIINNFQEVKKYYKEMEKEGLDAPFTGNKFWCDYHLESLLVRIIGAFDLLYKLIDVKYNFRIKEDLSFKKEVKKKLKQKNQSFYSFVNSISKKDAYTELNRHRINFVHSGGPTNLSSGIEKSEEVITVSKGARIESIELIKATEEALVLLDRCVNEFKKYL